MHWLKGRRCANFYPSASDKFSQTWVGSFFLRAILGEEHRALFFANRAALELIGAELDLEACFGDAKRAARHLDLELRAGRERLDRFEEQDLIAVGGAFAGFDVGAARLH